MASCRKMESANAPRSRKIKLHKGEEILRLPEEIIIEEILPRLRVKSLLKFRCVSKQWCSLILSKKFMKAHLRNSIKSSSLANHMILFDTDDGFKHCSLPSLFNEPFTDAITYNADFDFGIDYENESASLVGCCNGLVCILINRKRFILWNPTTKKSNNLPDFGAEIFIMLGNITKCGFGFDELNDDYKVFGVLSVCFTSGVNLRISKVYSLRSDSWEIVEGGEAFPYEGVVGTHLSGKLHWDNRKCGIVSFDLNSKVYGVVEQPSFSKNRCLRVLKGCLSVYCFHPKSHIVLWVMKEYGVKESWDKVATVPYHPNPLEFDKAPPTTVTIGPNGEVLLNYDFGSTLLFYNTKGNVFRHLQTFDGAAFATGSSGIYIESLESVVPDDEQRN